VYIYLKKNVDKHKYPSTALTLTSFLQATEYKSQPVWT